MTTDRVQNKKAANPVKNVIAQPLKNEEPKKVALDQMKAKVIKKIPPPIKKAVVTPTKKIQQNAKVLAKVAKKEVPVVKSCPKTECPKCVAEKP